MPDVKVVQFHSEQPGNHSCLLQPSAVFPILAEAIQEEIAFFSYDVGGNIVFVSKSAEHVFNHNYGHLVTRPFSELLSDASVNASFRSWNHSSESIARGHVCEVVDRDGNRLKLKCWRVHILKEGVPVGVAGVVRRLNRIENSNDILDETELRERAVTLTVVEKQVVEMVVDGMMNKQMAATLNVAVRTIESRRSRAMAKLQTKSISELVKAWVKVRSLKAANENPSN